MTSTGAPARRPGSNRHWATAATASWSRPRDGCASQVRVPRHVRLLVEPVADVLVDGQRIEERVLLAQHADIGAHPQEIALLHGDRNERNSVVAISAGAPVTTS
jgi:hypothetical protein